MKVALSYLRHKMLILTRPAGCLTLQRTTAGADVTVTATAGNITESVNNADLDIQANTVNLNATAGNAYIRGHGAGENLEIDSVLAVNADTSGGDRRDNIK